VHAKDYSVDELLAQGQQLEIPLYQRRYIWELESQWAPLWNDVRQVADRTMANPLDHQRPHFLGSIVIQQLPNDPGAVQRRTVIDGQQRLTTLQLLLDATHAVLTEIGLDEDAGQLDNLILNKITSKRPKHERFKVWPLNADQMAFEEVMSASPPVNHESLENADSRFVRAHKFFSESVRSYLIDEEANDTEARAAALVVALRVNLKLVVISLEQSEDPQEIFETLNARGVRLTSADLIKNFIFQRLIFEGEDATDAYLKYWTLFETPFWERKISKGRYIEPRVSIFLGQFLISRVADEIKVDKVFDRFKKYISESPDFTTLDLLKQIHALAVRYEALSKAADEAEGTLTPMERFLYRVQAMDTETVKPLLLHLLDPSLPAISNTQIHKALDAIESWLVRRACVRATGKAYNKLFPQIISDLLKGARADVGDFVSRFLKEQTADSLYWPDDETVRRAMSGLGLYSLLSRPRLRMILEGLEDELRNPRDKHVATPQQPCERKSLQVEHVMPRRWEKHWPLQAGESKDDRKERINRIGNLTLLTPTKNAAVKNGPWKGNDSTKHKLALLKKNTTFLLNSHLVDDVRSDEWTIADIDRRCKGLATIFIQSWPAPEGHTVNPQSDKKSKSAVKPSLDKLIAAGLLEVGTVLDLRGGKSRGREAQVLEGGILQVDDETRHNSPSGAAKHIRQRATNGWIDWGLKGTDLLLIDLWNEYAERFGADAEEDPDSNPTDEDEEDEDEVD